MDLFEHATNKYGGLDHSLTLLLFKMIDMLKSDDNEAYDFIAAIGNFEEDVNIYYLKDKINDFLYKEDPNSSI